MNMRGILLNYKRLSCFFYAVIALVPNSVLGISIDDISPQIIGRHVDGDLFALTRLENKPKLINFFWVGCAPCKRELPLLAQKEVEYPNVVFSAIHAEINYETGENYTLNDIGVFTKSLVAFPINIVLASYRIKKQFGLKGYPANMLLDKNNKIEKILYGFNESNVEIINAWLAKKK